MRTRNIGIILKYSSGVLLLSSVACAGVAIFRVLKKSQKNLTEPKEKTIPHGEPAKEESQAKSIKEEEKKSSSYKMKNPARKKKSASKPIDYSPSSIMILAHEDTVKSVPVKETDTNH